MYTIKWTQPEGAINIIETKGATVLLPKTKSFDDYIESCNGFIHDKIRAIVIYDTASIHLDIDDKPLYIVNENGKTVQTA